MPAPLTHAERVAVARLHAMLELLPTALDKRLAPAGITSFEFTLLERLAAADQHRLRLSDLASQTNATLPRLSRVASSLQRRGLIERRPCPGDGRATNAVLTALGIETYRRSRSLYDGAVRELVLDGLTEDDVSRLTDLTFAILTRLDPDRRLAATAEQPCAADPQRPGSDPDAPAPECPADPSAAPQGGAPSEAEQSPAGPSATEPCPADPNPRVPNPAVPNPARDGAETEPADRACPADPADAAPQGDAPDPAGSPGQDTIIFGADWCGDCRRAKLVFDRAGAPFRYVDLVRDPAASEIAREISGRTRIPVIVYPDRSHQVEPSNAAMLQKIAELGLGPGLVSGRA